MYVARFSSLLEYHITSVVCHFIPAVCKQPFHTHVDKQNSFQV